MGADQIRRVRQLLPASVRESLTDREESSLFAVEFAIAKTNKYALRESGDTAELIERPGGGLTVVMVDGQGSGVAAKMLSNALASKAVAMVKEGARDGTVARATHDYLHSYRGGKVSATLDLISVDLASASVVVSRNSHCPLLVRDAEEPRLVSTRSEPIGPHRHTRPEIVEFPMKAGLQLVAYTDGVLTAGQRTGHRLDLPALMAANILVDACANIVADTLLEAAIAADDGRPADDMTIVALTIHHREETPRSLIRRMHAVLPLDGLTPRRW